MKFFTFCIAAAMLSIAGRAQNVGVTTYNATTIYSQEFKKIVKTSDGGFLTTANTGVHGRITKMNSGYVIQWAIQIDSMPFFDAVETNDGNYVFLGFTYKMDYPLGGVHILKTTPTGTVLFERMYYDPSNANSVIASGIAKAAGTDNGFVFYGGNCIAMQYLAKCDANGIIQWQYSYAGSFGSGTVCSVITEATGYTLALFTVSSTVGLLKVNALGNPMDARILQTSNGTYLYYNSLVKLNSGDYFLWTAPTDITGAQNYTISNSFANITCNRVSASSGQVTGAFATGNANDEVMLSFVSYNNYYGGYLKVAPSGTIAQQKYSSSASNVINCLGGVSLNNGSYLFNGTSNNNRAMIAVVDESGNGFCSSQVTAYTAQQNYSFTQTTPTLYSNAINIASATANYPSTVNTYTILNVCGNLTGVNENTGEATGVSVYPNPFASCFSIERATNDAVTVNIIDGTGRVALTRQTSGTKIVIETGELANGVYSIQLVDAAGVKVLRAVKSN